MKKIFKILLSIIITIFLLGTIGGIIGTVFRQDLISFYIRLTNKFPSTTPIKVTNDFQYGVNSCKGGSVDAYINDIKDWTKIKTLDKSIRFNQIIVTNCAADGSNFKLTYKKEGNNLEINEVFDSNVFAMCSCPIMITGLVSNLDSGIYKIKFIYDDDTFIYMKEFKIR